MNGSASNSCDRVFLRSIRIPKPAPFQKRIGAETYREKIRNRKRSDRINDGADASNYCGIVPSLDDQAGVFSICRDGLLGECYRRRRFNMHSQKNLVPVADPAQDSAGMVGLFQDLTLFIIKGVIVEGTSEGGNLSRCSLS